MCFAVLVLRSIRFEFSNSVTYRFCGNYFTFFSRIFYFACYFEGKNLVLNIIYLYLIISNKCCNFFFDAPRMLFVIFSLSVLYLSLILHFVMISLYSNVSTENKKIRREFIIKFKSKIIFFCYRKGRFIYSLMVIKRYCMCS